LGSRLDDIDLNLDEFVAKVNSDLVGKVVNLASRSAKFVAESGLATEYPDDEGRFQQAADAGEAIAEAYEQCDYNRGMRLIMELADQANTYVEQAQPWNLRKDETKAAELQQVCTIALNLFRQLVIYLQPVLPQLATQTEELLGQTLDHWDLSQTPLTGTPVSKFKHMLQRVDRKDVDAMIEESKDQAEQPADDQPVAADSNQPLLDEPLAEQCTYEDFMKVDLRVVRVLNAEHVEGARKLLKLTLGLGGDEQRTVFAGIKQAYQPDELVGRLAVMVANLAPREMSFGTSEGMIVASGPGGEEVFLACLDEGAQVGQRLH
jgi:methionyl-tRNA synthetase